jgi:hypothetical protein
MKYHGKELIAFFKGTKAEFDAASELMPIIMRQAADMRNTVSPFRKSDFI